ncbi:nuclear transport factor 2 family protein [Noviherbaspirillum sp.]|uniref:nuclear transport factor 2 family protein n=1 Tax=Noviherbaspirillum sp. TaxID=1926288 RepID=UPI002FE206BB
MQLAPAVQASLDKWHHMVSIADMRELNDIIHPDAVFRSPMAFHPYAGGDTLATALRTVLTVFEDFRYHRQFSSDPHNVALEFSARVGTRDVKGIDLIRFNDDGLITDFEVMVRPGSGLAALGEQMSEKLGAYLKAAKATK